MFCSVSCSVVLVEPKLLVLKITTIIFVQFKKWFQQVDILVGSGGAIVIFEVRGEMTLSAKVADSTHFIHGGNNLKRIASQHNFINENGVHMWKTLHHFLEWPSTVLDYEEGNFEKQAEIIPAPPTNNFKFKYKFSSKGQDRITNLYRITFAR